MSVGRLQFERRRSVIGSLNGAIGGFYDAGLSIDTLSKVSVRSKDEMDRVLKKIPLRRSLNSRSIGRVNQISVGSPCPQSRDGSC